MLAGPSREGRRKSSVDRFAEHREALVSYLADRRQAEAIDSQIRAVRELAA
jgi:hypothetical protein